LNAALCNRCFLMASFLRKPNRHGQIQSLNLSTRRGALHPQGRTPKGGYDSTRFDSFNGRKRFHGGDKLMADITADHIVQYLDNSGFAIMKNPPAPGAGDIGRLVLPQSRVTGYKTSVFRSASISIVPTVENVSDTA
jgi:hypothetical protein